MQNTSQHPIALAVAPLRQASVDLAIEHAQAYLQKMKSIIDAEPDLDVLAPSPKSRMGKKHYMAASQKRRMFEQLTTRNPNNTGNVFDRSYYHVMWSEKGAARYLADTVAQAEANFNLYVSKLIGKVERDGLTCSSAATVSRPNVWAESTLRVSLSDGTAECWRTKMIWNTSVYGKVFAQYPTRLKKL